MDETIILIISNKILKVIRGNKIVMLVMLRWEGYLIFNTDKLNYNKYLIK